MGLTRLSYKYTGNPRSLTRLMQLILSPIKAPLKGEKITKKCSLSCKCHSKIVQSNLHHLGVQVRAILPFTDRAGHKIALTDWYNLSDSCIHNHYTRKHKVTLTSQSLMLCHYPSQSLKLHIRIEKGSLAGSASGSEDDLWCGGMCQCSSGELCSHVRQHASHPFPLWRWGFQHLFLLPAKFQTDLPVL